MNQRNSEYDNVYRNSLIIPEKFFVRELIQFVFIFDLINMVIQN